MKNFSYLILVIFMANSPLFAKGLSATKAKYTKGEARQEVSGVGGQVHQIKEMGDMDEKKQNYPLESVSIHFDSQMYFLNSAHHEQIRKLTDSVKNNEKDSMIEIAAWSDEPFPGQDKDLSSRSIDLAQKRIRAVEGFLKELGYKGQVKHYNMAESAGWLANLFNTEESELKSAFAMEDTSSNVLKRKYRIFKDQGAPLKAILVLQEKAD